MAAPRDRSEPRRFSSDGFFTQGTEVRSYHKIERQVVELHWHEFYEMYLVIAGRGTHLVNDTEEPLRAGTFTLLTPADFHELRPDPVEGMEVYNVIFGEESLDDDLERLLFADEGPYLAPFNGDDLLNLAREFEQLHHELTDRGPCYRHVVRGSLHRILVEAGRRKGDHPCPRGRPGGSFEQMRVKRALSYLSRHFREPLTLRQVAERSHLSPAYFSDRFHSVTGETFQAYLRTLRLSYAHRLLGISDLPVTSICFVSGFRDLSNFERAFKRRYGTAPSSYQAAAREGDLSA